MWLTTLDRHHKDELEMKTIQIDTALYVKRDGAKLVRMSGTNVDDILRAESEKFCIQAKKTHSLFEMDEKKDNLQIY